MSSTIFSATSGTSISVDPHADVEGAGQQNPVVPHDAQNEAPAPGNPPNEDLRPSRGAAAPDAGHQP